MPFLRGFTLAEIMVAMVMVSLVLVGGLTLGHQVFAELHAERLFHEVESQFFSVSREALAAVSYQHDVEDLPEMYHLSIDRVHDEWWVFKSRPLDVGSKERRVLGARQIEVATDPFRLGAIWMEEEHKQDVERVLFSWSATRSDVRIDAVDDSFTEHGSFMPTFRFSADAAVCDVHDAFCRAVLVFHHIGTDISVAFAVDAFGGLKRYLDLSELFDD